MMKVNDTWKADDLPTLEGSELSAIAHVQQRLLDDVDADDEIGMRWLLERPEALIDARRYGAALAPRRRRSETRRMTAGRR